MMQNDLFIILSACLQVPTICLQEDKILIHVDIYLYVLLFMLPPQTAFPSTRLVGMLLPTLAASFNVCVGIAC